MNLGERFPKLLVTQETFDKRKSTLLLTGIASLVGTGAMWAWDALGFVGEPGESKDTLGDIVDEVVEME